MRVSKRTIKKTLRVVKGAHDFYPKYSSDKGYVLLCLPFDKVPFKIAQRVFFPLIDEYNGTVKAVIHQAFFPIIKNIDPDHFITVLNSDIGNSLLPSKRLVKEIFQYNYIAAADLNIDFNLITAYFVHNSNAQLRVGFKSDHSDLCFNTQIDKKEDDSIEPGYLQIKSLLISILKRTTKGRI